MQLRPHQQDALDAMLAFDKGQIVIPTGGGKTPVMFHDLIVNCQYIDNGMTTVVVAPRILLAEQLCSEFLEHIDTTTLTFFTFIVEKLITSLPLTLLKSTCSSTLHGLLVRM